MKSKAQNISDVRSRILIEALTSETQTTLVHLRKLPPTTAMHLVFHVSQLRLEIGDHTLSVILTEDVGFELKPKEIIEQQKGPDGQNEVPTTLNHFLKYMAT